MTGLGGWAGILKFMFFFLITLTWIDLCLICIVLLALLSLTETWAGGWVSVLFALFLHCFYLFYLLCDHRRKPIPLGAILCILLALLSSTETYSLIGWVGGDFFLEFVLYLLGICLWHSVGGWVFFLFNFRYLFVSETTETISS